MSGNTVWQDNIRDVTDGVLSNYDNEAEIVGFTLHKYNAASLEDLSPRDYAEVFDELNFIANNN